MRRSRSHFYRRLLTLAGILLAGAFLFVFLRVPQGFSALFERHHEIRQLQLRNADLSRQNQLKRERIHQLRESRTEQEKVIRERLKLLKPGETDFVIQDDKK